MLFDLDGTLLDTLGDLHAAVNAALAQMGLAERTLDEVRMFVGNGVGLLGQRAVGPEHPHRADEFQRLFKASYEAHMEQRTAPYPGVLDALDALNGLGIACCVVSNKYDGAVKALCERYFGGRIRVALGERSGVPRKPAPDMCQLVMRALGVSADDCVYVGDADTDVNVAKNAGMRFVGVAWGFRGRAYLLDAGASMVVDNVEEMVQVIAGAPPLHPARA